MAVPQGLFFLSFPVGTFFFYRRLFLFLKNDVRLFSRLDHCLGTSCPPRRRSFADAGGVVFFFLSLLTFFSLRRRISFSLLTGRGRDSFFFLFFRFSLFKEVSFPKFPRRLRESFSFMSAQSLYRSFSRRSNFFPPPALRIAAPFSFPSAFRGRVCPPFFPCVFFFFFVRDLRSLPFSLRAGSLAVRDLLSCFYVKAPFSFASALFFFPLGFENRLFFRPPFQTSF